MVPYIEFSRPPQHISRDPYSEFPGGKRFLQPSYKPAERAVLHMPDIRVIIAIAFGVPAAYCLSATKFRKGSQGKSRQILAGFLYRTSGLHAAGSRVGDGSLGRRVGAPGSIRIPASFGILGIAPSAEVNTCKGGGWR